MKRWLVGTLALAVAGAVSAGGPGAVRKQLEASMLLTGQIVVATDGHVASYELDHPEKIPADVATLIQNGTREWHFQPVLQDGKPVNAKARMNIRVVARRESADSTNYVARISGATFGEYDAQSNTEITYAERKPPTYPQAAASARVSGTVYLILRIDHDGHVVDATAEQVNLGVVAGENDMKVWRNVLAGPSVAVAKRWTFRPPTAGPHANDPFYVVRVPIVYNLRQDGRLLNGGYGEWQVYVPGPKQTVAWANDKADGNHSVDAIPDGQLALVGTGLQLITPLDQG